MAFTTLSLDLGATTGWAYFEDGVLRNSGELKLTFKDAHPGLKFHRLEKFLIRIGKVDMMVFEEVPFISNMPGKSNPDAAMNYGGYRSIIERHCYALEIPIIYNNVSHWKKVFTGSGRADKFQVCAKCHSLGWVHGRKGSDVHDNEADAIGSGFAALIEAGMQISIDIDQ